MNNKEKQIIQHYIYRAKEKLFRDKIEMEHLINSINEMEFKLGLTSKFIQQSEDWSLKDLANIKVKK